MGGERTASGILAWRVPKLADGHSSRMQQPPPRVRKGGCVGNKGPAMLIRLRPYNPCHQ